MRTFTVLISLTLATLMLGGCSLIPVTSHIADYQIETETLGQQLFALVPDGHVTGDTEPWSKLAADPSYPSRKDPFDTVWWTWDRTLYFDNNPTAPEQALAPLDTYLVDLGWTKTTKTLEDPTLGTTNEYRLGDERGGNWYIKLTASGPGHPTWVPQLSITVVSPLTARGNFQFPKTS